MNLVLTIFFFLWSINLSARYMGTISNKLIIIREIGAIITAIVFIHFLVLYLKETL
jgi:uncharacterized protein (DUF486 family)